MAKHKKEIEDRRNYYPDYRTEAEWMARMLNAYIGYDIFVANDIPRIMMILKIGRAKLGVAYHEDNYVDQRGYSELSQVLDRATAGHDGTTEPRDAGDGG